jgi:tRNA threonylcarbamoyladenosine biosynthesis protein TsaB
MNLLALDTSTLEGGVALYRSSDDILVRSSQVTTHSEALLGMIDLVLREAGISPSALDGVVCGAGPGSFTGLRIGFATAKGLCFAVGCPLVLVSSLEALAQRAGVNCCATLDAYQNEVYAAIFRSHALESEEVLPPAELREKLLAIGPVDVVGTGAARYPELLTPNARLIDTRGPHPADVARLGARAHAAKKFADLASAAPRYIRPSEPERIAAKKLNQKE